MTRKYVQKLFALFVFLLLLSALWCFLSNCTLSKLHVLWDVEEEDIESGHVPVHIAVVMCQNRLELGSVMMKSAVIFSRAHIVLHIFTDILRQQISNEINSWPERERRRLKVNIYQPKFISGRGLNNSNKWANLYRPCAAQRLFFPDVLPDVDSLIYLDADTLFLAPIEDVWAQFNKFNSSQMVGIVPDLLYWRAHQDVVSCHPTGLNSGMMLMNLTRIRSSPWNVKLQEYFVRSARNLRYGDQDLINIYCHNHPHQFYFMPCSMNYNYRCCSPIAMCKEKKAHVLHGIRDSFHKDEYPVTRVVYRAIKQYNMMNETHCHLYNTMVSNLKPYSQTECGKLANLFTHHLEKCIHKTEGKNGG